MHLCQMWLTAAIKHVFNAQTNLQSDKLRGRLIERPENTLCIILRLQIDSAHNVTLAEVPVFQHKEKKVMTHSLFHTLSSS